MRVSARARECSKNETIIAFARKEKKEKMDEKERARARERERERERERKIINYSNYSNNLKIPL